MKTTTSSNSPQPQKVKASSSAWEVVPEKKVARKIGVKSDSELDHPLKKAVKEAKGATTDLSIGRQQSPPLQRQHQLSAKDLFATVR